MQLRGQDESLDEMEVAIKKGKIIIIKLGLQVCNQKTVREYIYFYICVYIYIKKKYKKIKLVRKI